MRARAGAIVPLRVLALIAFVAALLPASVASAQNEDAGATAAAKQESDPGAGKDPDTTRSGYWAEGSARPFFATSIDLGYLYLRPRAIVGYGRPFWTWIGFEANPQVSQRFLGAYAGVRAELPFFDLRLGSRYVFSFQQAQLRPREEYGRLQLESRELPRLTYYDLEAELTGAIPFGPGSVLLLGTANRILGVPKDVFVFDQVLRVIVDPPWVYRGRIGFGMRLGPTGRIGMGLVGEVLHVPERHASTIRAGIIATASLSNHLEVIGSFIPPFVGPDTLGIAQGDFGQLGIRYRWATGTPNEAMVVPVVF